MVPVVYDTHYSGNQRVELGICMKLLGNKMSMSRSTISEDKRSANPVYKLYGFDRGTLHDIIMKFCKLHQLGEDLSYFFLVLLLLTAALLFIMEHAIVYFRG